MDWDDCILESVGLDQTGLVHPLVIAELTMLACPESPFHLEESIVSINLEIEC